MKTTLEILENEINHKLNQNENGENWGGKIGYRMALEGVLRQIKNLKDEEKRLICDAYQDSRISMMNPEQYFNEKFNKSEQ